MLMLTCVVSLSQIVSGYKESIFVVSVSAGDASKGSGAALWSLCSLHHHITSHNLTIPYHTLPYLTANTSCILFVPLNGFGMAAGMSLLKVAMSGSMPSRWILTFLTILDAATANRIKIWQWYDEIKVIVIKQRFTPDCNLQTSRNREFRPPIPGHPHQPSECVSRVMPVHPSASFC